MTELRRGLQPLPLTMQHLPIDERGYPVPWFVCKIDGKWDFRIADAEKRRRAVKQRLCWLCGLGMGKDLAFVIGPMCAVNRNTSEPPCHLACAEYAAQNCPFMILPAAKYRDTNLPDKATGQPFALPGNPGATCVWITHSYQPYTVPQGWLIQIGHPIAVQWWCEGKRATRAQIMESLERRLPTLREIAAMEGPEAELALNTQIEHTLTLLPPA